MVKTQKPCTILCRTVYAQRRKLDTIRVTRNKSSLRGKNGCINFAFFTFLAPIYSKKTVTGLNKPMFFLKRTKRFKPWLKPTWFKPNNPERRCSDVESWTVIFDLQVPWWIFRLPRDTFGSSRQWRAFRGSRIEGFPPQPQQLPMQHETPILNL